MSIGFLICVDKKNKGCYNKTIKSYMNTREWLARQTGG